MRSKWHKPASCHAPRTGLLLTPPSLATRRTRRSRTPHKAPRRLAIIAQSRRHAQLATPATHDVVISTLRVPALHRATGAQTTPATQSRRLLCTCGNSTQSQVRHTTNSLINTRHSCSARTVARRLSPNNHLSPTISVSCDPTSTQHALNFSNHAVNALRSRSLKQTRTPPLHWWVRSLTPCR